jgi:hypothetical protein
MTSSSTTGRPGSSWRPRARVPSSLPSASRKTEAA